MPLTMKDIAGMFGVSESTVSRAINGKPGVGEELRGQILALVEKHQYKPNALARGLASNETRILGLVLPDITHPHNMQILRGIEEQASELNYHLILANTGGNRSKEAEYLSFFQQNRVQGIICIGSSLAEDEILRLGLNNFPLVLVNKLMEELALPTLLVDHAQGAELAVKHLQELGHEQIGLVIGSLDELTNLQIYEGYSTGLTDAELEVDSDLIVEVENSRTGGYQGLLSLLQKENPPTAVFAATDLISVGVVEAIKFGGLLIPDDIAVIGYGDTQITEIIDPPLTTIGLPLVELGREAIRQLVKVLQKVELEEPFIVLESTLIKRRST